MCLLFLYLNDDESSDGYRLILANNRDEEWDRATHPLRFWTDHPDCISGLDLTTGKEGGTWLGASKKGRFGILLNILGKNELGKRGRGHLVNGYLTSNKKGEEYLNEEIISHSSEYNSFHLILLDLSSPKSKGIMCSNSDGKISTKDVTNGILTSDNATPGKSWRKSVQNKGRFEQIVQKNNKKESRNQLVDELLGLLKDKTPFENDNQLAEQAAITKLDEDTVKERSASFVWSPKIRYGTRTHSIILVDCHGQCEFIEQTMKTPVDEHNVQWKTTSFTFKMAPSEEVSSHL